MEGLAVLAVLVVLGIPVAIIVLFVMQGGLRRQVAELRQELGALRRELVARSGVAAPATQALRPADGPETPVPANASADLPVGSEAGLAADLVLSAPLPESPPERPPVLQSETAGPGVAPEEAGGQAALSPVATQGADQNRPIVLRPDRFDALIGWLKDNWVYAIAGLSLAFAGIFLVQWGMERGLLPPAVRVLAGMAFGGGLILGGEWIRRRHGDGPETATAYLPSVFSGAGIVSLFAAVTAARQLFGLVGAGPAFAGLFAVAGLAIVLGWRHGPLLAALGLVGATLAPFVVGGASDDPALLHLYFLLVAVVGLGIDAVRRWAWISVLALVLSFAGGVMLQLGGASDALWIAQLVALPLAAAALPDLSLRPVQGGATVTEAIFVGGKGWPGFPTRLATGTLAASSLLLVLIGANEAIDILAWGGLTGLVLAFTLWAAGARGMADLAALPLAGFLLRLVSQVGDAAGGFELRWIVEGQPVPPPDPRVWMLVGMAAVISGGFGFRALRETRGAAGHAVIWGLAAVTLSPLVLVLLEVGWRPSVPGLSPAVWAFVVLAHAAGMTVLALRFAAVDGGDRRRVAHAALSALSLIALALFVLTTKAPLTLALAVLLVAAAWLDRRFDLPECGAFVQLGLAVLMYRLVVDPGVVFALEAPLGQVLLAHLGALAGVVAAWWLMAPRVRPRTRLALESGGAVIAALLVSVLLTRSLIEGADRDNLVTHWGLTLNALPWMLLALAQLYRLRPGQWGTTARVVLALAAGAIALAGLLAALGPANPLVDRGARVLGPPVIDTLLVAYALPGSVLLIAQRWLGHLPRPARMAMTVGGIILLTVWAALEIRRLWQGPDLSVPGVSQPELYSYTLAMMTLGAVLLWQAIARRASGLRRLAMIVIGLTAAKVFLIDGAGLTGLVRVLSFLGLGLTLAGLAWVNRWAARAAADRPPAQD